MKILLDFNVPDSLPEDDDFELIEGGELVGIFQFQDLPIEITELPYSQGEDLIIGLIYPNDSECVTAVLVSETEINCGCEIDNVTAEVLFCETDTTATYLVDFDFFDVGDSGYTIEINNESYPSFSYEDLPLEVVGPYDSNPDASNILEVIDIATIGCVTSMNVLPVVCEFCELSNLQLTTEPCEEGSFQLTVDFDFENPGDQGFSVSVNGSNSGSFNYDEVPMTFGAFTGEGEQLEVLVIDNLIETCTISEIMEVEPCLVCGFSNVQVFANPCDDGQYSLNLNFDIEEGGASGFNVFVNGIDQGAFNYELLPIDFGMFSGLTPANMPSISIFDVEDPTCFITESYVAQICAEPICVISGIELIDQSCLDDSFFFEFDIEFNALSVSDSFDLDVHQVFFGRYAYDQLPVQVDDLGIVPVVPGDFALGVVDSEDPSCGAELMLKPPDCSSSCFIENISVTELDGCNDDGEFEVLFDSDFEFESGGQFIIIINEGSLITRDYDELPFSIGGFVGDGETAFNVELIQADQNSCTKSKLINPVSCPTLVCSFEDVELLVGDCVDGFFNLSIVATPNNAGSLGFDCTVNNSSLGTFQYTELPLDLGMFLGDDLTTWAVVLSDVEFPSCTRTEIADPVFCQGCEINNLVALPSEDCEAGFFDISLNFAFQEASETGFTVTVNGGFVGQFLYQQLPLLSLPGGFLGDGTTNYNIIVADSENPNCSATQVVKAILCDEALQCSISSDNLVVLSDDCNEQGFYTVLIDFEVENPSPAGFNVFVDGVSEASFNYSDLPITIELGGLGSASHLIGVGDIDDPTCLLQESFFKDCSPPACALGPLEIIRSGCDSDQTYNVVVDFAFNRALTDTFSLFINGEFQAIYEYIEVPFVLNGYTQGDFLGDNQTTYTFDVIDLQDSTCISAGMINEVDCSATIPCIIGSGSLENEVCNENGTYSVELSFSVANPGDSGFSVVVNEKPPFIFDAYLDDNGPYLIEDFFLGDGETELEVTIFDNADPSCDLTFNTIAHNCEEDCLFEAPFANAIFPCSENGLFEVEIGFNFQNAVSDSFILISTVNDQSFGPFSYEDENPATISNLLGDGITDWGFEIFDAEDSSCTDFVEVGVIDCSQFSCNIDFQLQPVVCTDPETFSVEMDVQASNTGSLGFEVLVNGIPFGEFQYEDLTVNIEGIQANGLEYTFRVQDIELGVACSNDITLAQSPDCATICPLEGMSVFVNGNCVNGFFPVEITLVGSFIATDSFVLIQNSEIIGKYLYEENPITINVLGENQFDNFFQVRDVNVEDCIVESNAESVDCTQENCSIFITNVVVSECSGTNEVTLEVFYDSNDVPSDALLLSIGVNEGDVLFEAEYAYGAPIIIGPYVGDGTTIREIELEDQLDSDCRDSVTVGPYFCEGGDIPRSFTVGDPWPNPSNQSKITLDLGIPSDSQISFEIFDTRGNLQGSQILDAPAGEHELEVFLDNLNPGVYIIRINREGISFERKFMKGDF